MWCLGIAEGVDRWRPRAARVALGASRIARFRFTDGRASQLSLLGESAQIRRAVTMFGRIADQGYSRR